MSGKHASVLSNINIEISEAGLLKIFLMREMSSLLNKQSLPKPSCQHFKGLFLSNNFARRNNIKNK